MEQKVKPILQRSAKLLLEQQNSHDCWSFPAHLGSHYISLYALFLEWLRFRGFSSRLNLNRLATILVETQLADGSWKQARDPTTRSGDLNATVLNYAALKFFRTSISVVNVQPALAAAGKFILAAGGMDATNQFIKTFLALFGLRGWEEIGEIPYVIFLEALPLNYRQFSQWVIPHLIPMRTEENGRHAALFLHLMNKRGKVGRHADQNFQFAARRHVAVFLHQDIGGANCKRQQWKNDGESDAVADFQRTLRHRGTPWRNADERVGARDGKKPYPLLRGVF